MTFLEKSRPSNLKFLPFQSAGFVLILFIIIHAVSVPSFKNSAAFASKGLVGSAESTALLTWKASLENQSQSLLSSWVPGSNPCTSNWTGIDCSNRSLGVRSINLDNFGLKGTLFNLSFSSFPNLTNINLNNNSLYGTIPSHIGHLSSTVFVGLGLSTNNFSGKIPPEIGMLTSLINLVLNTNNLTGPIPPSVGNLGNLTLLYLSGNQLSGTIPPEVGNLRSLTNLDLSTNNLMGTIPASIGNLTNLGFLYLYGNMLSGSIPHEIGLLTSLYQLQLMVNDLTGPIPASLGNLSRLTSLGLYQNQLTLSPPFVLHAFSASQTFLPSPSTARTASPIAVSCTDIQFKRIQIETSIKINLAVENSTSWKSSLQLELMAVENSTSLVVKDGRTSRR